MSKNSIDKLFKDRLSKHEEPYPQHLWEGVYDGITGNVSRKRRGAFWYRWMLLGVLLLMAGGTGWYIWQSGESSDEVERSRNENVLSMDSSQAMLDATRGKTGEIPVLGDSEKGNASSTSENETGVADGKHKDQSPAAVTDSGYDDRTTVGEQGYGNNLADSRDASSNQRNNTNTLQSENESSGSANKGTDVTAEQGVTQMAQSRGTSGMNVTALEGYGAFRLLDESEGENTRLMRDVMPELNTFQKRRFVGHWGVAVVYGQDIVSRNIEARNESDLALLNQRSASESFVNAFMTGFEVNIKVRKWTLYSGLHYTQINERVNYTLRGTERTVNGNPVVGDLKRSVINRYQMLSIPVYVGYEVTRGPWALEAQGGVNIGLSLSTSGEVFDRESLTYMEYDNNSDNNPYQDNPGMSCHGALMLSYKTGYGQRLFLRPNIRWYNSSFTRDDYGLEQNYQSYGITAGYRVRL